MYCLICLSKVKCIQSFIVSIFYLPIDVNTLVTWNKYFKTALNLSFHISFISILQVYKCMIMPWLYVMILDLHDKY